jgi:hypothetical protein
MRREPFELWLLAACCASGLAGLLAPGRAAGVLALLPPWERYTWSAGLLLGGGTALAGVIAASPVGLLVERIGLCVLAGWCCGYGAAVVGVAGLRGTVAAAFVLGFAAACAVRAWQIGRQLRAAATGAALLRRDLDRGES